MAQHTASSVLSGTVTDPNPPQTAVEKALEGNPFTGKSLPGRGVLANILFDALQGFTAGAAAPNKTAAFASGALAPIQFRLQDRERRLREAQISDQLGFQQRAEGRDILRTNASVALAESQNIKLKQDIELAPEARRIQARQAEVQMITSLTNAGFEFIDVDDPRADQPGFSFTMSVDDDGDGIPDRFAVAKDPFEKLKEDLTFEAFGEPIIIKAGTPKSAVGAIINAELTRRNQLFFKNLDGPDKTDTADRMIASVIFTTDDEGVRSLNQEILDSDTGLIDNGLYNAAFRRIVQESGIVLSDSELVDTLERGLRLGAAFASARASLDVGAGGGPGPDTSGAAPGTSILTNQNTFQLTIPGAEGSNAQEQIISKLVAKDPALAERVRFASDGSVQFSIDDTLSPEQAKQLEEILKEMGIVVTPVAPPQ